MAAAASDLEGPLQTGTNFLPFQISAGLFYIRSFAVVVLTLLHLLQRRKVGIKQHTWTHTWHRRHCHSSTPGVHVGLSVKTLQSLRAWLPRFAGALVCMQAIMRAMDVSPVQCHLAREVECGWMDVDVLRPRWRGGPAHAAAGVAHLPALWGCGHLRSVGDLTADRAKDRAGPVSESVRGAPRCGRRFVARSDGIGRGSGNLGVEREQGRLTAPRG